MQTKPTDKSRPAFVVLADPKVDKLRCVHLVARLSDLDCRPMCMASSFCGIGHSDNQGEPPTIDRDFIRERIYTCNHRDNFTLRPIWTEFNYEAYPLSDEDIDFFKPYINAIEDFYSRKVANQ